MYREYSFGLSWIIILTILPTCWSNYVLDIIEERGLTATAAVKRGNELELSLFTETFGFVDDTYLQAGTAWHDIMQEYVLNQQRQTTQIAYDTKITQRYLNELRLCKAYLKNPVFEFNGIAYAGEKRSMGSLYEQKLVRLHYFSRARDEVVNVVGCPVTFQARKCVTRLYFQEISYYQISARWSMGRAYFVFAHHRVPEVSQQDSQEPLELLMMVVVIGDELPTPPRKKDVEAILIDSRLWNVPCTPRIRLRAPIFKKSKLTAFPVYTFGYEAELHFLNKLYGYVDFTRVEWGRVSLGSILDRMKHGFEVDRMKMKQVRADRDTTTTCLNYIQNNPELQESNVVFREDLIADEIEWHDKKVIFPISEIIPMRRYDLLQCPVQFDGEYELHYLYILPVHYLDQDKAPQLFSFVVHQDGQELSPDVVLPYVLSPVDLSDFRSGAEGTQPRGSTSDPEDSEAQQQYSYDYTQPGDIGPSSYPGYSGGGSEYQGYYGGSSEYQGYPGESSDYQGYAGGLSSYWYENVYQGGAAPTTHTVHPGQGQSDEEIGQEEWNEEDSYDSEE